MKKSSGFGIRTRGRVPVEDRTREEEGSVDGDHHAADQESDPQPAVRRPVEAPAHQLSEDRHPDGLFSRSWSSPTATSASRAGKRTSGQNIAPQEIEMDLKSHPLVSEAVVVLRGPPLRDSAAGARRRGSGGGHMSGAR